MRTPRLRSLTFITAAVAAVSLFATGCATSTQSVWAQNTPTMSPSGQNSSEAMTAVTTRSGGDALGIAIRDAR